MFRSYNGYYKLTYRESKRNRKMVLNPKKEVVQNWRRNNPKGTKADCIRETGLSKPTVYKWWL